MQILKANHVAFIWPKRLFVKADELEQNCSRCIFSHSFSAIKFRQMVLKNVANHQLFSNWLGRLSIIWISYFSIFSLLTFGLSTILLKMALSQRTHSASEWKEDGSQAGGLIVSCLGPHQPWTSLVGWDCTLGQRSTDYGQPKSGQLPAFLNKVLLEQSHTHLLMCYLWLLFHYNSNGWVVAMEVKWLQYLPHGPLEKQVPNPV